MKKMLRVISYCLLAVFFISGCGYTTHSLITEKNDTIYVRQFKNSIDITSENSTARNLKTYFPGLETEITKAVIDRFVLDGSLRPGDEYADLALKGELTEYRRDPLSYDQDNLVKEYRVTIVVNISLWDNLENKLLWSEDKMTGDSSYLTQGTLVQTEEQAVKAAVLDLARRVVERVTEDW